MATPCKETPPFFFPLLTYISCFEFEHLPITLEDIAIVQENTLIVQENITAAKDKISHIRKVQWLTASHIRLFCLYLRAYLSRRESPGLYFFGPLAISDLEEGWDHLVELEDAQNEANILSASYLVFPISTNDHWFTIIISTPDGLASGQAPTAYILDPLWNDWGELHPSVSGFICQAMPGSAAHGSRTIQIHEGTEGTVPQQSRNSDLCGYYILLYMELLARDPDVLLERIRDFNTVSYRLDHMFEPGDMDGEVVKRFAGLIKEFQHSEQREGRLVTESGCSMFDGDLACLARGVNLV
jgi:hypothetical protein